MDVKEFRLEHCSPSLIVVDTAPPPVHLSQTINNHLVNLPARLRPARSHANYIISHILIIISLSVRGISLLLLLLRVITYWRSVRYHPPVSRPDSNSGDRVLRTVSSVDLERDFVPTTVIVR